MKITRFEPWSYVDLMHRDLKRSSPDQRTAQWVPATDIIEEESQFSLRADLPGVRPQDIEITMDVGVLTVSGVRQTDERDESAKLRRSERVSGRFSRQFTLPESTDADKIKAKSSNGILEIVIPKLPEIAARQISVEAA
jgi:HSP20 family protein